MDVIYDESGRPVGIAGPLKTAAPSPPTDAEAPKPAAVREVRWNGVVAALKDVAGWLRNEGRHKHARHVQDGIDALMTGSEDVRAALTTIAEWRLPATGEFWQGDPSRPISYEAQFGSNGSRDYMRGVARAALATLPRTAP